VTELAPPPKSALFGRLLELARHRHAVWVLAFVAFADSSFLPVPPHALLIPMALAHPRLGIFYGAVATLASVLGGYLGYGIGYVLFDTVGRWVIDTYGYQSAFQQFQEGFAQYGIWIIIGKGLTPIPFKIVTIAAGAAHFPLWDLTWSSVISRGMQFFAIGLALKVAGPKIAPFIERRLFLLTGAALALIVLGFLILKWL